MTTTNLTTDSLTEGIRPGIRARPQRKRTRPSRFSSADSESESSDSSLSSSLSPSPLGSIQVRVRRLQVPQTIEETSVVLNQILRVPVSYFGRDWAKEKFGNNYTVKYYRSKVVGYDADGKSCKHLNVQQPVSEGPVLFICDGCEDVYRAKLERHNTWVESEENERSGSPQLLICVNPGTNGDVLDGSSMVASKGPIRPPRQRRKRTRLDRIRMMSNAQNNGAQTGRMSPLEPRQNFAVPISETVRNASTCTATSTSGANEARQQTSGELSAASVTSSRAPSGSQVSASSVSDRPQKRMIQARIDATELQYVNYSTPKGKKASDVWESFYAIKATQGEEIIPGWAACKKCRTLFDMDKGGLRSLRRHVKEDRCKADVASLNQPLMDQHARTSLRTIPTSTKRQLVKHCVGVSALDLKPFTFVEGDGFLRFVHFLVSGNHALRGCTMEELRKALPSATTISRNTVAIFETLFDPIRSEIEALGKKVSFTTDSWLCENQGRHYIGLTAHWISADWKMRRSYLGCHPCSLGPQDAAVFVWDLKQFLADRKIQFFPGETLITADEGSVVQCALRDDESDDIENRLGSDALICAGHKIQTIVRNALDYPEHFVTQDGWDDMPILPACIGEIIKDSKDLYLFAKKTGLNKDCLKTIKGSCATRWNSLLYQLESIYAVLGPVQSKSKPDNKFDSLLEHAHSLDISVPDDIKAAYDRLLEVKNVIEQLIKVLQEFNNASVLLQSESFPTLWQVKILIERLRNTGQPIRGDSIEISVLRKRIQRVFEKKVDEKRFIKEVHLAATFLHPSCRKKLSPEEKDIAREMLRKLIVKQLAENDVLNAITSAQRLEQNANADQVNQGPIEPSSTGTIFAEISDDEDADELETANEGFLTNEQRATQQLHDFETDRSWRGAHAVLSLRLKKIQDPQALLEFWRDVGCKKWPELADGAARLLLATPATSAVAERLFSTSGTIVTKKRTSLAPDIVSMLVFLNRSDEYRLGNPICRMSLDSELD